MGETITSTSGNSTLTLPGHVNAPLNYFDELRTSIVDLLDKIEAAAGGGGILNRDSDTGVISADTGTDTIDIIGVTTDTIDESTSGEGVTIEGVLLKDSEINVDTIDESTSAAGVTIEGVLLKDAEVNVDTINESTSAAGVTIDGVLAKDGGLKCSGAINIAEIATPTAVPDYCALYTKSDNKLYFQDGAGVEHEVTLTA